MITTLFVESEESLICAAGMPLFGGKLVGVYFGDLRGHPWHSLNDCFPPDMEAVVLVVQYGYRQELRIGHLGYEGLFVDEDKQAAVSALQVLFDLNRYLYYPTPDFCQAE